MAKKTEHLEAVQENRSEINGENRQEISDTAPPEQMTQTGEEPPISQATETEIQETANAIADEPKVVVVRLRQAHPQDSYGRAGYRFTKTQDTHLPYVDLSEEQVLALYDDPWLDVAFLAG